MLKCFCTVGTKHGHYWTLFIRKLPHISEDNVAKCLNVVRSLIIDLLVDMMVKDILN